MSLLQLGGSLVMTFADGLPMSCSDSMYAIPLLKFMQGRRSQHCWMTCSNVGHLCQTSLSRLLSHL